MDRSVYRIIDVNFNRGREAVRMMEEYCRFTLNSRPLSSRAKNLRHRFCGLIDRFDTDLLMASRDSQLDVGRALSVDDQLKRQDLKDCFIAAAKRLTEALRVLAETTQIIDPAAAAEFEDLRFCAYSLEKDVSLAANARGKYANVRLYVLITVRPEDSISNIKKLAKACAAGGADCIQVRAKGIDDSRALDISKEVVNICADNGVVSIVNDRVDIAVLSQADGVHLGQGDISVEQGKSLQSSPLIFGVSTHSVEQLRTAIDGGADYVGIGPVFETNTKPLERVAGLEYVKSAIEILADSGIAHAAIGGITLENIDKVLSAGAKTIAVCSAITDSSDPQKTCRRFKDKIESFS